MCGDSVAPQVRGPFACGDVCVCVCPIQGVPDDAVGLKRLRADLESILTESNKRTKMLAIELTKIYDNVKDINDLPELLLAQIKHFFEHYKELEAGKWVKVDGWDGAEAAKAEIIKSVEAYENAK